MKRILTILTVAAIGLFVLLGNAAEWAQRAWVYFEENVLPSLLSGGVAVAGTGIMSVILKRYINKGMSSMYLTQKEYGRQTAELSELQKEYADMADKFCEMKTAYDTMLTELSETTRLVRGAIASSAELVQSGDAKKLLAGKEGDGNA